MAKSLKHPFTPKFINENSKNTVVSAMVGYTQAMGAILDIIKQSRESGMDESAKLVDAIIATNKELADISKSQNYY